MRLLFAVLLFGISYSVSSQSEPSRPRLNHTAIYVQDLKATRNFYEKIIGLDSIPEPFRDGRHAWYEIGPGISMHVIQGAPERKEYYKNQHTCFTVPSVETFTRKLKEHNIAYEDVAGNKNSITKRIDGVKQIWLQDPDGYWIEINDVKY